MKTYGVSLETSRKSLSNPVGQCVQVREFDPFEFKAPVVSDSDAQSTQSPPPRTYSPDTASVNEPKIIRPKQFPMMTVQPPDSTKYQGSGRKRPPPNPMTFSPTLREPEPVKSQRFNLNFSPPLPPPSSLPLPPPPSSLPPPPQFDLTPTIFKPKTIWKNILTNFVLQYSGQTDLTCRLYHQSNYTLVNKQLLSIHSEIKTKSNFIKIPDQLSPIAVTTVLDYCHGYSIKIPESNEDLFSIYACCIYFGCHGLMESMVTRYGRGKFSSVEKYIWSLPQIVYDNPE